MNKEYYNAMMAKGRLMPFFIKNKMHGFVTFYIGSEHDESKFVRNNMWDVLEDNPYGSVAYIDQLWTNDDDINKKFFRKGWIAFRRFIKDTFPRVKLIRWNRWYKENNIVKVYKKEI